MFQGVVSGSRLTVLHFLVSFCVWRVNLGSGCLECKTYSISLPTDSTCRSASEAKFLKNYVLVELINDSERELVGYKCG